VTGPPASVNAQAALASRHERAFFVANGVVSVSALALIAFILLRDKDALSGPDLAFMPAVNAVLNTLSAACLVFGFAAIRRQRIRMHRTFMVSAFVLSSLFLVGYLAYHSVHGDTRFTGEGAIRAAYFFILITHIVLSMAVVPMALTAFYFAFTRSFDRHKRVTRVLLPLWLYVSVSGVVIFLMLRAHAG
jgi:putative membrane protein